MITIIISLLLIAKCSWCIPLDQFYPFGADENDQELKPSDAFPVIISENFTFEFSPKQALFVRFLKKHVHVISY